ncbi:MAG: 30S ribosomal protein S1 [Candidatus Promineifilaceae bacterium]
MDRVDSLPSQEVGPISNTQQGDAPLFADSSSQSAERAVWDAAQKAFEDEEVFKLSALGCNKGGILVEWHGLSGFIPASQLNNFPHVHLESERIQELQRRQHQTMRVKMIEVNQMKNRLIFSERAALVEAQERRSLWDDIRPGDVREGVVTNMAKFGTFVDLGGVEGLIHISELSWSRLTHPSDVIRAGQHVKAVVLEVDRPNGRIALSMKRMRKDPWIDIERRYKPGQVVHGEVNNVVQFGAFVTLEEQLEGLIHISELAEGSFLHPRNVVRKGDRVVAKVLNVDGRARRLALTLRGLTSSDQ